MAVKRTWKCVRQSVNDPWEDLEIFEWSITYTDILAYEGKASVQRNVSEDGLIRENVVIFFDKQTADDFIDFHNNHPLAVESENLLNQYCAQHNQTWETTYDFNYSLPS